MLQGYGTSGAYGTIAGRAPARTATQFLSGLKSLYASTA